MGKPSPAARLLCCIILVTAVAISPKRAESLLVAGSILGLLWVIVRPNARTLSLRAVSAAVVVAALVAPLIIAGRTAEAAYIAGRAGLCTLLALTFANTLSRLEVSGALAALRVPRALASVIDTMLQQAEVLADEGRRVLLALRLRGASGPVLASNVLAALLVRSVERAERVDLAMRLRGYESRNAGARAAIRASDLPVLLGTSGAAFAVHAVAWLP